MAGFFARLFPRKTLAAVREPTPVRVDARMASPNTLVSPISGHAAALISWRFYTHYTDRSGRSEVERHALVGAHTLGEDVVLETAQGTVFVPARGRKVEPALSGHGLPLDVPLPPQVAHLMTGSLPGLLYYDELLLRTGDPVRLRATVAPRGPSQGTAYRSTGEVHSDFEALPDHGPVVVEDVALVVG